MPAAAAIPWLGTAIAGGAAAGAQIYGANKQSSAADKGLAAQTAAANQAAQLQAQTARESQAYLEKKDAADRADAYAAQKASYNQWAARENRLSPYRSQGQGAFTTLGSMLGIQGANIPGPGPAPAYLTQGAPQPGSGSAAGAASGGGDLSAAQASFNALFPGDTLTPDMVKGKEKELAAAGFTLRPNAAGVVGKVQYQGGPIIDIIQGAGSGLNKKQWLLPSAAGAAPRTIASLMPPIGGAASTPAVMPMRPSTPALQMPSAYSLASLMKRSN